MQNRVPDGSACRHQIAGGGKRPAFTQVLAMSLDRQGQPSINAQAKSND
jgi:hypothetical protein